MTREFEKELTELINKHSLEGTCGDTPDFILAEFVINSLRAYSIASRRTKNWNDGEAPTL